MKRTLLSVLTLVALVAAVPVATAADMQKITGHVFDVTNDKLVITTDDGPRMFIVSPESDLPDQIADGDMVTVWYTDRPATQDIAVVRVEPALGPQRLSGEVVEITDERVAVRTGGTTSACTISLDTQRPADLAVGENVDVWYTAEDDDLVAARITRSGEAVGPHQATGHVYYLTPTTLVLRTPDEARMFTVTDESMVPESVDVDDYIEVWYEPSATGELEVTRIATATAPTSAGTVVAERDFAPTANQPPVTTVTTTQAADTAVRCYTGVIQEIDDDEMVLMTDTGRTVVAFDTATRRPYGLREGDRVDVWCLGDDVDRVALLERDVTTQVAEQPQRTTLPQTASRLPLLGLLGLIGVGLGVALRFAARA